MDHASVFMNGRSQAVRLPQACRFDPGVKSVRVRKVGNAVILEPVETAGWDPAYWAAVTAMPAMEEEIVQLAFPIPEVEGL
jgi:antitoxin VapB